MTQSLTPEQIKELVGDTPNMSLHQGKLMTRFLREHAIRDILELGTKHGVSTCYFAGALTSQGGGSITTLDLAESENFTPPAENLLDRCGYRDMVSIYRDPTSYTWQLKKFLEEDPTPRFDLCYLDGAHSWSVDGFAFFLVERLLRPGGWIIFDDLDWTFSQSPTVGETEYVRNMPQDERDTPQVRLVYELLVKTHPNFGEFGIRDDWAYAQKLNNPAACVERDIVIEKVYEPYTPAVEKVARRVLRLMGR